MALSRLSSTTEKGVGERREALPGNYEHFALDHILFPPKAGRVGVAAGNRSSLQRQKDAVPGGGPTKTGPENSSRRLGRH